MLGFAVKRLLGAVPTLLIMIALAFFLIRVAPGGPFDAERQLPAEVQANLDKAYHLDEPLYQQFGRYLYNLAQGDFGPSFQYRDYSVTELIASGFPVYCRWSSSGRAAPLQSFRFYNPGLLFSFPASS